MTRGVELNNPMNLMQNDNILWSGEIKPTSDPEGRLCQFDKIENGIRAGCINLTSYYLHDGCDTIQQIITRYAPESENPTSNYISFISAFCGIGANDAVVVTDPSFLIKLCGGIIRFEQGFSPCSDEQIASGVSMALSRN